MDGPICMKAVWYCNYLRSLLENIHHSDVIMGMMASRITSVLIVCSTVSSSADQREHQSSTSLAFVRGIHRWPVNSPNKRPVTGKTFPFDDVIKQTSHLSSQNVWSYLFSVVHILISGIILGMSSAKERLSLVEHITRMIPGYDIL